MAMRSIISGRYASAPQMTEPLRRPAVVAWRAIKVAPQHGSQNPAQLLQGRDEPVEERNQPHHRSQQTTASGLNDNRFERLPLHDNGNNGVLTAGIDQRLRIASV